MDHITTRKIEEIESQGYTITGKILSSDRGAVLVHCGAVRWIPHDQLYLIMHPTADNQAAALVEELRKAHLIIRNALNCMDVSSKLAWGVMNRKAGCDGEGSTRANEREAVLAELQKNFEEFDAQVKADTEDVESAGHRLALELECLLMDTKDMPTVSKWWGPAMSALEAWRDLHQGCGAYRAGYANQITYAKAQSRVQPNGSDSKDAARYRFLRHKHAFLAETPSSGCELIFSRFKAKHNFDTGDFAEDVDAAIDSAMKGGA